MSFTRFCRRLHYELQHEGLISALGSVISGQMIPKCSLEHGSLFSSIVEGCPTLLNHLKSVPPPFLYYYTSASGLLGIIENKALWATHLDFLNDSQEMKLAIDMMKEIVYDRYVHEKMSLGKNEDFLEFYTRARSCCDTVESCNFVASLTENGDQLSQWRAYSPPGGGFSIGFPSDLLKVEADSEDWLLCKCIYDTDMHRKILTELFNHCFNRFEQAIEKSTTKTDKSSLITWFSNSLVNSIINYGPILKHPSFHEEKEWRLISPHCELTDGTALHRAGKVSIIPYLTFNLTKVLVQRDGFNNFQCVSGPTPDQSAKIYGLQSLLVAKLDCMPKVEPSKTPYRGS